MVKYLLNRAEGEQLLRMTTHKGETALMAAAKGGKEKCVVVVEELLKHDSDVNQRADGAGRVTALHLAASKVSNAIHTFTAFTELRVHSSTALVLSP